MGPDSTALTWFKRGLLAAVAVAVVALGLRATGSAVATLDLADGSIWLSNPPTGSVVQLNAASDQVIAEVKVGQPGSTFSVAQSRHSALVLNRSSGEVGRVDGSTLAYTDDARSTQGAAADLQLAADDEVAYLVDSGQGRVEVLDPTNLETVEENEVPAEPSEVRVAGGDLWMLSPETGSLTRVGPDGDTASSDDALAGGAPSALAVVGDDPYVVSPGEDFVAAVDKGSASLGTRYCLEAEGGRTTLTAGTGHDASRRLVLTVDDVTGELLTTDLETDTCVRLQITQTERGGDEVFDRPAVSGDTAFLPLLDQGAVLIVDLIENKVLKTAKVLPEGKEGNRFELVVDDGNVWFNNLEGPEAGTLDRDGIVLPVLKYGGTALRTGEGDGERFGLSDDGEGVDLDSDEGLVNEERDPADGDGGDGGGNAEGTGEGEFGDDEASGEGEDGSSSLDLPELNPPQAPSAEVVILPPASGGQVDKTQAPVPLDESDGPTVDGPAPIVGGAPRRPLPVAPRGQGSSPGDAVLDDDRDASTTTTPSTSAPGGGEGGGGGGEDEDGPPPGLDAFFLYEPELAETGKPVEFIHSPRNESAQVEYTEWQWDFGDGSTATGEPRVSHTYESEGEYFVTLTVGDGERSKPGKAVRIQVRNPEEPEPPRNVEIAADPERPETGREVLFQGLAATKSDFPITQWTWDFGDGSGEQEGQVANHTYETAGAYIVTLTVANEAGETTADKKIEVVPFVTEPVAAIDVIPPNPTTGQPVEVRDLSSGPPEQRRWDITGPSSVFHSTSDEVFSTSFDEPGTYTIELRVENRKGSDTTTREVVVAPAVTPPRITDVSVRPAEPEVSKVAQLTAVAENNATSFTWFMGDTTEYRRVGASIPHAWQEAKTYTVRVIAHNETTGDSEPFELKVRVVEPAPAQVDAAFVTSPAASRRNPVSVSDEVTFDATASTGDIDLYAWDFGDGRTAQGRVVTHRYESAPASGFYTVRLRVVGGGGFDGVRKRVWVADTAPPPPEPKFTFNPARPTAGEPVSFTDLSTNASSWAWNFGDGGTSSARNPTYTYTQPGSYTVSLTVANGAGQQQSTTAPIQVDPVSKDPPAPTLVIEGDPAEWVTDKPITFTDTTPGNVTTPTFTIRPGVGEKFAEPGKKSVTHTFDEARAYTVSVRVCWVDAPTVCGTSDPRPFTVNEPVPKPVASFGIGGPGWRPDLGVAVVGEEVVFTADEVDQGTYNWTINGQAFSGRSVSYTLPPGGLEVNPVTVKLLVKNPGGTSDPATRIIDFVVPQPPTVDVEVPDQVVANDPPELTAMTSSYVTEYRWELHRTDGAGPPVLLDTGTGKVYAIPAGLQPGRYEITLVASNAWGSSDPPTVKGFDVVPPPAESSTTA